MILYHGSLEIVMNPEIREPNRTLDYGKGFYLTSSYEQAEKWVKSKLKGDKTHGYVNAYQYDPSLESSLSVLDFPTASDEWVDFVMANRTDKNYTHDYDIVKGPVANDNVYAAFALYEGGLFNKEQLIVELKTYKLVNQILLHTERALPTISFIEAKEVAK